MNLAVATFVSVLCQMKVCIAIWNSSTEGARLLLMLIFLSTSFQKSKVSCRLTFFLLCTTS